MAPAAVLLSSSTAGALSSISSITFKGTAAKPTIVVKGSGFGSAPAASPTGHPNGQANCPAFPAKPAKDVKNDGFDYGTDGLWLEDATSGWRAGDYVPSTGELDCVGLQIKKWTPTEITFKPGTAYDNPSLEAGHTYILATGDSVSVDVLGLTATTTY
jgi:hypothetical protein